MTNYTIDELNRLDGVKSAGTDLSSNPYTDPSLTIFLKNGYRLISNKDLLGQSISLEPFGRDTKGNNIKSTQSSYYSENYHSSDLNQGKKSYYELTPGKAIRQNIHEDTFHEKLKEVVSKEIYDFLQDRHQQLAHQVSQRKTTRPG